MGISSKKHRKRKERSPSESQANGIGTGQDAADPSRKKHKKHKHKRSSHRHDKEKDVGDPAATKVPFYGQPGATALAADPVSSVGVYDAYNQYNPSGYMDDVVPSTSADYRYTERNTSSSRPSAAKRPKVAHSDHDVPKSTSGGRANEPAAPVAAGGDSSVVSLSIEDTNRIRAKLGLAPLRVNSGPQKVPGSAGVPADSAEPDGPPKYEGDEGSFLHVPAQIFSSKKDQEKLREKLETQRKRRELLTKLNRYKGLADIEDGEIDSATGWVNRNRQVEREKLLAQQRAKILEEMDEEFGIGDLVEREITGKVKKGGSGGTTYDSKQLAGIKVQHDQSAFVEGKEVILVLKDKEVLDEEEGENLINPTIVEQEMWARNADLRKKKPGYNPYEEEADPFAQPKALLSKYDEEIEGQQKSSFTLDDVGQGDTSEDRIKNQIRANLQAQAVALESRPLALATEYYTTEEMEAKFKKPKRRVKKIRKRSNLKADDLLSDTANDSASADMGSRIHGALRAWKVRHMKEEGEVDSDSETPRNHPYVAASNTEMDDYDEDGPSDGAAFNGAINDDKGDDDDDDDSDSDSDDTNKDNANDNANDNDNDDDDDALMDLYSGPFEEDEAEKELASVLAKTRRLRQQEKFEPEKAVVNLVTKVGPIVKEEPLDEGFPAPSTSGTGGSAASAAVKRAKNREIVLDSISEYCRGLGEIPTYGKSGNRADTEIVKKEDMSESSDDDEDDSDDDDEDDAKEAPGGWVSADFEEPIGSGEGLDDDAPILEEEAALDTGIGGALKLALQKGLLEKQNERKFSTGGLTQYLSKNCSVMDKSFQDIDDKYARKLERMGMGGPIVDFREKKSYCPDVKLEYADQKGRLMGPKEAFNFLSWKFHGKKPGKKKMERLARKKLEEQILKEMVSSDTPLNTLEKQIEKQRSLQSPYIVLSGQGAKDVATVIKKS